MDDQAPVVTVWSDIHCPWAATVVHRLRKARDRDRPDLVIDQRPWPLELVNGHGSPRYVVEPETAVLADHESDIFASYRAPSWPSTFLPAFELVAAARRVHGLWGAEAVDYALRLSFFRDTVDVSIRPGLVRALDLAEGDLDREEILRVWDGEPVRSDVLADYQVSKSLPIQGSPQVFWPDGTTTHNPGLTEHEWVRGIPRIRVDDREAPAALIRAHVPRRPGAS